MDTQFHKSLRSLVLLLSLASCGQHSDAFDPLFMGFRHPDKEALYCGGRKVDHNEIFNRIYPKIMQYLQDHKMRSDPPEFDYKLWSSVSHRRRIGAALIRYEFETPLENAPLGFDGGVAVVVEACSLEIRGAAFIVY